jgi:glutamine amidotransferase
VRKADRLVMPGQGAFRDCAIALGGALGDAVRAHLDSGRPYLGICLGLQVLFASSTEAPSARGLGIFPGEVVRLAGGVDPMTATPLKIPHMGWNVAEPTAHPGLLRRPAHYYFVHSYVVAPSDPSVVAATTDYGAPFVSAIAKDNVFACQFHPEKSQAEGLALLERFLAS